MRVEDIFLTLVKDILQYKVIKENENMNKVTLNSNSYSNKKKIINVAELLNLI